MPERRRAGLLLHPSSLASPWGIGDIGTSARDFVRWLAEAGQSVWQMLPTGPVDGTGSPYASLSAFAGNPLLLSLDDLAHHGWLLDRELPEPTPDGPVDFARLLDVRPPLLHLAAQRYAASTDLSAFTVQHPWVEDWAMYAALSRRYGTRWTAWPTELRLREPGAIARLREQVAGEILIEVALQSLYDEQFHALRMTARDHGVELWGDVPFFVGGDGADTWVRPELFRLDDDGQAAFVSGVPPDAFSELGQRWGHPLYDEPRHRAEGYRWWIQRIRRVLHHFDRVRVDHFRGLCAYWEIPASAADATEGRWIPGPGRDLLQALVDDLGELPLIAEDLGVITPDVEALRDDFGLAGMAVLQFAFGDADQADNPHLPHNHRRHQVVFSGTHDNDTAVGWWKNAAPNVTQHACRYLGVAQHAGPEALLRATLASVAETALVPLQDLLELDSAARMNTPGQPRGNWTWRLRTGQLREDVTKIWNDKSALYGRLRNS